MGALDWLAQEWILRGSLTGGGLGLNPKGEPQMWPRVQRVPQFSTCQGYFRTYATVYWQGVAMDSQLTHTLFYNSGLAQHLYVQK